MHLVWAMSLILELVQKAIVQWRVRKRLAKGRGSSVTRRKGMAKVSVANKTSGFGAHYIRKEI